MLNLSLQKLIFQNPSRMALMEYQPNGTKHVRIGIYRNHSFELIEHTIAPFLDFSEITAEFVYSDYDDSLTFFELDKTTDLLILWLDLSRYQTNNLDSFLHERLRILKESYKKPILAVFLGKSRSLNIPGIVEYSLSHHFERLGNHFLDLRLEAFSGTKLSAIACMDISKDLGLRYIPALLFPNLKAIVLDLDNTLYRGILGEDGYDKLQLSKGHIALQNTLKDLKHQGFFLCIASKNNEDDVKELFNNRLDFPLKWDDFAKVCCSWNAKSQSIQEISRFLNIGTESILFVDDNPGELISVNHDIPEIKFLLAQEDALKTQEILNSYPGLLKLQTEYEDTIRTMDAQANQKRAELRSHLSKDDYIRSLNMTLQYQLNNTAHISRIVELANKTNQFIFNYKRYSRSQIEELMGSSNTAVVTVELSDSLSDSGIICVCTAEKQGSIINITECFVSCRALGRGIDEIIVKGAIEVIRMALSGDSIHIEFQKGPRNLPAEKFIEHYLSSYVDAYSHWSYRFPDNLVNIKIEGV